VKWINFLISFLLGVVLWNLPIPEGVNPKAWQLFSIFVGTIYAIVSKPFPMGAVALMCLLATQITDTLSFNDAFIGFSSDVVWLVILAFFIARGFIITGFGSRIAYNFVKIFGRKTLGLGYGLVLTELMLAPAVPSVTARAGGIVYPILQSIAKAFGSDPVDGTALKLGSYLTLVAFQATGITSAMFLTAMAGNPLVVQLASDVGVTITWGSWALAAIVPGLLSLLIIPYVIYKLYPPVVKETPNAKEFAISKLKEMGPIKKNEWIMIFTFILLLVLWIFSSQLGVKPAITALIGIVILIITNVLHWKDILKEENAWDTLIWFSTLLTMASSLNKLGLTNWFSKTIVSSMSGMNWVYAFLIITLAYFYIHYFFASTVAHIGAMYGAFLAVAIALGAPAPLAAILMAFFSNLNGTITHYSSGPAPIFYGSGYVQISSWWNVGFISSIVNVLIWLIIGGIWWRVIGLW
jgi:DASS family divalent anion:Na+ symporter